MAGSKLKESSQRATLERGAAVTWESLAPEVLTLVAVDGPAIRAPLSTLTRIQCPGNEAGTPYVRGLFEHAASVAKKNNIPFAGYANGDIAFDSTVIDILSGVLKAIDRGVISDRVVLVGKRLNIFAAHLDAMAMEAQRKKNILEGASKEKVCRVQDCLPYPCCICQASALQSRCETIVEVIWCFFFGWQKTPRLF